MIIIGIDPGLDGAVVVYDTTTREVVETFTMPTLTVQRGKSKKRKISAVPLSNIIAKSHARHAYLEEVHAMPGQGSTSMFSFGRSFGVVEGILAALDMPLTYVPPQRWQKACSMKKGKDGAKQRATELFPAWADEMRRSGCADAALIAHYGCLEMKV